MIAPRFAFQTTPLVGSGGQHGDGVLPQATDPVQVGRAAPAAGLLVGDETHADAAPERNPQALQQGDGIDHAREGGLHVRRSPSVEAAVPLLGNELCGVLGRHHVVMPVEIHHGALAAMDTQQIDARVVGEPGDLDHLGRQAEGFQLNAKTLRAVAIPGPRGVLGRNADQVAAQAKDGTLARFQLLL